MTFKKLDFIVGWAVFFIASAVYILTIEPTASFWDCGEYIASSYKLLIGHPPGNPIFWMVGRIFTLFAGGNVELVPVMINIMSALCSSFTILFLFWSIVHLARKIVVPNKSEEPNMLQTITILGSAAIGALAYTFTDSFWFSAVEGEVYAMSALFTAITVWAIFKWENEADKPHSNRWLIFIAYVLGLSIAVHLLNLLTVPIVVFVYYFKKYQVTTKGIILTSLISVGILISILYILMPGVLKIGSWVELLTVNSLGLPINAGLAIYSLLLFALVGWLIWITYKKGKVLLNTILLCLAVILLGYGSYAMVIIRSSTNIPMNENEPSNVFALMSYLGREQYGDRPLFRGPSFNAPVTGVETKGDKYAAVNGKYQVVAKDIEYTYDHRFISLFPRMYGTDRNHQMFYNSWNGGYGGQTIRYSYRGKEESAKIPTFFDNVSFFFTYQLNYMYFRYFMWNFVGRQNDLQGNGEYYQGNWISGISFIDNARLGDQSKLPDRLKNNKGNNTYYFLPLILGILGMLYQYSRSKRGFTLVAMLFFFTGIAIVIYLNQTPIQPRERDYAYAGSFYAFAMWIGLGVAGLIAWATKQFKNNTATTRLTAAGITALTFFAVPVIMATENWDDHDRSDRYLARDFAYNYLKSVPDNAVLFTYGDNDTFPLWYALEVEGIADNVRVMNLSYTSAEWYIAQMNRKAYRSEKLPLSMSYEKCVGDSRMYVFVDNRENINRELSLKEAMDFVMSDDPRSKVRSQGGEMYNYFPKSKLYVPIDTTKLLSIDKEYVKKNPDNQIIPKIDIDFNALRMEQVNRVNLALLDLIANGTWERPLCWGVTVGNSFQLGLQNNFLNEGLANRLVPHTGPVNNEVDGRVNIDLLYDNIMNVYQFRGLNDSRVYFDETCQRMLVTYKQLFIRLLSALNMKKDTDRAFEVVKKYNEIFPNIDGTIGENTIIPLLVETALQKDTLVASEITRKFVDYAEQELRFIDAFSGQSREAQYILYLLSSMKHYAEQYKNEDIIKMIDGSGLLPKS